MFACRGMHAASLRSPTLHAHGHAPQLVGHEAEQEEAQHRAQIHAPYAGDDASEQAQERVRELLEGLEGLVRPARKGRM